MFLRNVRLKSRSIIAKPKCAFFQSRTYLTGAALAEFRKDWHAYTPAQRLQIAVTEDSPPCGDVYITKGDYFMQEMQLFQAHYCYVKAKTMTTDCTNVANERIAALEKLERKIEPGQKLQKPNLMMK